MAQGSEFRLSGIGIIQLGVSDLQRAAGNSGWSNGRSASKPRCVGASGHRWRLTATTLVPRMRFESPGGSASSVCLPRLGHGIGTGCVGRGFLCAA